MQSTAAAWRAWAIPLVLALALSGCATGGSELTSRAVSPSEIAANDALMTAPDPLYSPQEVAHGDS